MYKTVTEAIQLVTELKRLAADIDNVEILVCPSFVCLTEIADLLEGSNIKLGAQNMYYEEEGAYTGEVSADMIKSSGASYVILGHSERRQIFKETNELINKKIKTALSKGLNPIVCIGEVLEERERGVTDDVIKDQLQGSLSGLSPQDAEKIVVAYEPVWAIGTGKTATPQQAQDVHRLIRDELGRKYGEQIAEKIRIQYGGSVKPANVDELMRQKDIDGALVGGASLKAEDFARIVKFDSVGARSA